jgi:hypothetical protein
VLLPELLVGAELRIGRRFQVRDIARDAVVVGIHDWPNADVRAAPAPYVATTAMRFK